MGCLRGGGGGLLVMRCYGYIPDVRGWRLLVCFGWVDGWRWLRLLVVVVVVVERGGVAGEPGGVACLGHVMTR